MALWAAFVIDTPHGRIYHVGDTGFDGGRNYRMAGETFGGFRLAILPIGSYEPRWFMRYHHQNPDEAVQGMKLCRAAHAIGHHWGTFHLANEPIDEPPRLLAEAARAPWHRPEPLPGLPSRRDLGRAREAGGGPAGA